MANKSNDLAHTKWMWEYHSQEDAYIFFFRKCTVCGATQASTATLAINNFAE